ncbi:MAG TPA: RNA methyltransferase [Candidatus Peribacterales bacterium]|nr:RNA methyltransferase [Candidatus Peribacterales bacterium]
MIKEHKHLCVIAHNIRSLWNVGSLFRTCDGFGVTKLYLTGYTGRPPRKEITKTALGAEEFVPWEHVDEPMNIVEDLKKNGYVIVSLEQTDQSSSIYEFKPTFPLCLILGNEIAGVRDDLLIKSDAIVEIPMQGKKESLNVAVAAGIALSLLTQ